MTDPIVDEIRRIRDAHAAEFNYDLDAIFRDLKERERKAGYKFVNGIAYPEVTSDSKPLQPAPQPLASEPSDVTSQPSG